LIVVVNRGNIELDCGRASNFVWLLPICSSLSVPSAAKAALGNMRLSKKEAPAGYGEPGLLQEIVAWVTINKCHVSFLASTNRAPGGCQIPNAVSA
jgi:hypothetical protein